jgi:hypothetical protein
LPRGPGGGRYGGVGSTAVQGWNAYERISNLRSNSKEMFTPSLTSQNAAFVAWTERLFGTRALASYLY